MHLPGGEERNIPTVSGTVADLNMRITVNVSTISQPNRYPELFCNSRKDAEVNLPTPKTGSS